MPSKKPRIKRSEAFLGIHFDFHADMSCKEVGKTLNRKMLADMLDLVKPDFVQCDCKGHPGIASYPTRVGTPAPGFVRDPLMLWREETAKRGISLYMHYSGVVDHAAIKQHPDWAALKPDGEPYGEAISVFGPYVDALMIPMFKELVDRYGIDGVWVDGECWGIQIDYSDHARKAWKAATGLDVMPEKRSDKHFERFRQFQRDGFKSYLAHYVNAMHDYSPGFEIASNWAYTAHMPEPVDVDVDFISGDVTPQDALAEVLMDARILSQQGKPWDLMSWSFNFKWGQKGPSTKTAIQLQQEAAIVLAAGGGYQVYFQQKRDAAIIPWSMRVMAETGAFCRARQPYCHRAEPVPQIGLILSTDGYYQHIDTLMRPWGRVYQGMRGILRNLLDSQNVVDIVMDHHLEHDPERYPLLVLPEWKTISGKLKKRLLEYVSNGGRLLLIGIHPTRMFKDALKVDLQGKPTEREFFVEAGDRMGGTCSDVQEVKPKRGAKVYAWLYERNEARNPSMPAAIVSKYGKGQIATIPMNIGERYGTARTTVARDFVQSLVRHLMPEPMVDVTGSRLVAVSLMRKHDALMVHLVNTGGPHHPACFTFDEVPAVGPLEVRIRLNEPPHTVKLQPDDRVAEWTYDHGFLTVQVLPVHIHAIIEIK